MREMFEGQSLQTDQCSNESDGVVTGLGDGLKQSNVCGAVAQRPKRTLAFFTIQCLGAHWASGSTCRDE
jgi:hypothetical protein